MIPPWSGPTEFHIGSFTFALFGTLVATGVLVGHAVVMRFAAGHRIPEGEIRAAAAWALGAGFLGAHAFDVIVVHPERIARDGLFTLLLIPEGISSYGGFLGAFLGVAAYLWWRGKSWWAHADALVVGLVAGWVFGRLGCTLTSDHMGHLSSFPLAFAYPKGARHNLGFYEFVWTLVALVPAVLLLGRRERSRGYTPGEYVAWICLLYGPARFLLDFLRATDISTPDPRFFGLTFAQYASVALAAFAVWRLRTLRV